MSGSKLFSANSCDWGKLFHKKCTKSICPPWWWFFLDWLKLVHLKPGIALLIAKVANLALILDSDRTSRQSLFATAKDGDIKQEFKYVPCSGRIMARARIYPKPKAGARLNKAGEYT
jgi:hypothetical protein